MDGRALKTKKDGDDPEQQEKTNESIFFGITLKSDPKQKENEKWERDILDD